MSIGLVGGVIGSAAGAPLAQTSGSEVERAQAEAANQQRAVSNESRAADAAGIAATDGEDQEVEERDADGRRLWEAEEAQAAAQQAQQEAAADHVPSKDATGERGQQLDLSG